MQQIGVFAKYWEPGKVKTRLAATIGQEKASRIYRAFVQALLRRLSDLGERRILAVTPADRIGDFVKIAGDRWTVEPQSGGDLGDRMRQYFDSAFKRGVRDVLLLGSDSPDVPREFITQAFELLERFPVVLGPSEDGGYYLIAARNQTPPVFDDVPWSTSAVWAETVERLKQAGIPYGELPTWYDVDETESLERLLEALRGSEDLDRPLLELKDGLCRELEIH